MDTATIAKKYYDDGFALIPLTCDGRRRPRLSWRDNRVYRWGEIAGYFFLPSGIALLCGTRSGNLEVLDFDDPTAFPAWQQQTSFLTAPLPTIQTPSGGFHVYYRCKEIRGNTVLARETSGHIRIETRGEGGLIVAPGSPPATHPDNKPYTLISGNPFRPPVISSPQRETLWAVARQFNQYVEPKKPERKRPNRRPAVGLTDRPGDLFNQQAEWGCHWAASKPATGRRFKTSHREALQNQPVSIYAFVTDPS